MSENTILGGPPSDTDRRSDASRDPTHAAVDSPTDELDADETSDVPGDVATAYHRGRLYGAFALGFDRPGDELQTALAAGAYTDDLVESARIIDPEIGGVAAEVGTHLEAFDALCGRWASLFGVEEGITVSPYELTYLPGPLMTNVRQLADIRGFYDAFDLSIAPGRNDRGDHVCFLTSFTSHLSLQEAYLRLEGDVGGVAVVVDAQRRFLEDHLGRWYWRFAEEVSAHDDGFYAALGDLLSALVEYEIERLELDPTWVPDDPEVTEWNEDVFGDSGRSCGGCGLNDEGVDQLSWDGGDSS